LSSTFAIAFGVLFPYFIHAQTYVSTTTTFEQHPAEDKQRFAPFLAKLYHYIVTGKKSCTIFFLHGHFFFNCCFGSLRIEAKPMEPTVEFNFFDSFF